MADETIDLSYLQVGALDDLIVAGVASQSLSPSQFLEVSGVVKGDVFKDHIFPDICFCMTPFPEAANVAYLMMGFFNSPAGNNIGEAELDIPKFRAEVIA